MKFIKVLAVLLLVVMCGTMFIACNEQPATNEEKPKITLTVWASQEDQEMVKEMCAAYAAANPQNTYKFLFGVQGENDAADKVLNDVTSGPDVFAFASDQINKLYTGGALARIGGDIEKQVKANNTADSIDASTLTINGQDMLYAYPMTGDNGYYVYYDKRVYSDPSQLGTLDSMIDTAKGAGKNVHFALTNGWYLSGFFFAIDSLGYQVNYDENLVEQSVDINYNNADGLKVAQSIRDYFFGADGSLVINTDDSKIIAGFNDGTTAAAVTGIWNLKTIQGILGENMGVCVLPTANIGGEQTQLSSYRGCKLVGVNNYSQNKGEAHKLALWLTNEQNQLKRYEVRGFGPTNLNAIENPTIKNDPVLSVIFQQAEYARTQKGVPGKYWDPLAALFLEFTTAEDPSVYTDAYLQEMLDACVKAIKGE